MVWVDWPVFQEYVPIPEGAVIVVDAPGQKIFGFASSC
jgi:hypothetical protein